MNSMIVFQSEKLADSDESQHGADEAPEAKWRVYIMQHINGRDRKSVV